MSSPSRLALLLLTILATLAATATAKPPTTTHRPLFTPPLTPTTPPTTPHYTHPLLHTINRATLTSPTPAAIQPGQLNAFNFTRPEGTREFYLYVPAGYQAGQQYPFTFYFHGYASSYEQGIGFNMTRDAEEAGYIIAFPQGTPSSQNLLGWNGGVCCLFNDTSIVDDVEFTRHALRIITSVVTVNPTRIYTMGWSNGGFMSERLACEAADLFAGVCADASAVGILPGGLSGLAQCDKAFGRAALNYIHFHGTADFVIPWTGSFDANGTSVTPSALRDISRWTRRLECGAATDETYNDGTFSNLVWPDCRDGRTVEFMSVRDGVHAWWTLDAGGFETTKYVLAFFTRTWQEQRGAKAASEAVAA